MFYSLKTSLLPGFISDFNGINAFISNLDKIFDPVNNVPDTPKESLDHSEIIEWMDKSSEDMADLNQDIRKIINSGNYTQSQLHQLSSLQLKQQALLNTVADQVAGIRKILGTYLPMILAGISSIQKKNEEILLNIDHVLDGLAGLDHKVDELHALSNVSLSISQVSEAYEKLKSICNNFYALSNKMDEADFEDAATLASYLKAFEYLCRNISVGGPHDLSIYLDSIHSIIMGNGLDKVSLYQSYTEYAANMSDSTSASSELYQLYCNMTQLQVNAYSVYAMANKFTRLPYEHLEELLSKRLDDQKFMYKNAPYALVDFKTELDFYSSHAKVEKEYNITGSGERDQYFIKADSGKVLLSLKIDTDGNAIAYQANIKNNKYYDVDVVKGNNINKLFDDVSSSSAELFSGVYSVSGPNEYITAIGSHYGRVFFYVGYLDENGSYAGTKYKYVYLTKEKEYIKKTSNKLTIDLPVDIRDKYISPLTGFRIDINTRGVVNLSLMNDVHLDSYQLECGQCEHLHFWTNSEYKLSDKDYQFYHVKRKSYDNAIQRTQGTNQEGDGYFSFDVKNVHFSVYVERTKEDEAFIVFKGKSLLSEAYLVKPFVRHIDLIDEGLRIKYGERIYGNGYGSVRVKYEKEINVSSFGEMLLSYGFDLYEVNPHHNGVERNKIYTYELEVDAGKNGLKYGDALFVKEC